MSILCSFVGFRPFSFYICCPLLSILRSLSSSRTNTRTKTAYEIETAPARLLCIEGQPTSTGPNRHHSPTQSRSTRSLRPPFAKATFQLYFHSDTSRLSTLRLPDLSSSPTTQSNQDTVMGPRIEPPYQGKGKARLPIVLTNHRAAVTKANAYRTQSNRRNAIAGLTKKDTATVALFDQVWGTEAAKDTDPEIKAAQSEFLNRIILSEPSYQGKGKGKIAAATVRENLRAAKANLDLQFFGRRMSVSSMTSEEIDEVALHGMKHGKGSPPKADTRSKLQKKFISNPSHAQNRPSKGGQSVGTFMRRFNGAGPSFVKAPSVHKSSEPMESNDKDSDAANLPLAMSTINLNTQAAANPSTPTHSPVYEGSATGDISPLSLSGYSDEDMDAAQILVPKDKHAKAKAQHKKEVIRLWYQKTQELLQVLSELPDVDVEANLSGVARTLRMSEAMLRAEIGVLRSADDFVGLSVDEEDEELEEDEEIEEDEELEEDEEIEEDEEVEEVEEVGGGLDEEM
ncbi:hypothetical protein BDY17DRAFT_55655 [Neohortaea acidophila]|uniref:Uncharacterized protein n=1 Tax=Neohortaea acidophila TaxID=245834 RepID=A0A6A6PFA3_9PEZI|nr:uncharacterized protein BDY17DRAFT_55655 [Neohortaea acidophila]KAF2478630.1 hypothetical protein BDY17DRAFT_55655 [Neohortaea acidophila]